MRTSIALAAVVMLWITAAASAEVPPGWRFLKKGELTDPLRQKSPTSYTRAIADFNGDGINDMALILRNVKSQREALWVSVATSGAAPRWIKLAEFEAQSQSDSGMGIDLVAPGIHAYACFANSKDCDFGARETRPKLRLRDPSIIYFKLESAASLFFWSRSKQRFMQVWLSD